MPDLCHPGSTKGIQNHKGLTGFPVCDSFDSQRKEILGLFKVLGSRTRAEEGQQEAPHIREEKKPCISSSFQAM